MSRSNFYAPKKFTISREPVHEFQGGKLLDSPFILTVPEDQFKDPDNIPVNFTQVKNLHVYRTIIKPGETVQTEDEFLKSLEQLHCGQEVRNRYDDYKRAVLFLNAYVK